MNKMMFTAMLALGFVVTGVSANAAEYVFSCKNDWMQSVDVKVTADSPEEARQLIKTDPTYRRDFKLCSYRREIKAKVSPVSQPVEVPVVEEAILDIPVVESKSEQ